MRKVKKGLLLVLVLCMSFSCWLQQGVFIKAEGERVNHALHKPVIASYNDGNVPEKAVDGELGTRWGTDPKGSNQWLRVDLEKVCKMDEFRIASENVAAQKIRKYKIEGSLDDQTYDMIYDSSDKTEGFDTDHTIKLEAAVQYRFVKITVEKLVDQAYPSISLREFQVVGDEEEHISDVKKAVSEVSIPSKVFHDFEIPSQNDQLQVSFSWEALNDAIRIENGKVLINTDEATSSGLRLTASKGGYEQRQEFHFQIYKNQVEEYDLYPKVQSLTYDDQSLLMKEQLQLRVSEDLESYVKAYAQKIFSEYQFDVNLNNESVSDQTKVYLGIVGSGDEADTYFSTINYDKQLSTDVEDGYVLRVSAQDDAIAILGHDVSGVFNGLSTLRQMLETSRSQLKEVLILDSPNTSFRGIVEGFYGEYSFKERLDLIEYIGPLKMNTYIYGAKSDTYHRSKWREKYPKTEIEQIRELVTCGKKNNVELVWTAHVGGNIDMSSQADFDAIVNKFDQLYDVGVRQFGLFYDDASSDNTYLTEFVNRLNNEYIHKKEGVKNLIVCPQHYNKTQANDGYFAKLAAFDSDIEVMWTGDGVISEISPSMMAYIEEKIKRPAYIWWNYPVNDLGLGDQLLVGETVGLSNDMGMMNGLVSNPMLQAQASKFSLFSIADYSWNIADYNKHESWNAAVEYVMDGSEYEEAFKLFSANNNQSVAELKDASVESAYLMDDFDNLRTLIYTNEDASTRSLQLKEEFKKIEDACEKLKSYPNKDLVNQITPWMNQLLPIVKSGQVVMDNISYMSQHDLQEEAVFMHVLGQYQEGQKTLQKISGKWSGRREIIPFLQEMQAVIHQQLMQYLDDQNAMRFITNYRNGSYVMMDLTEMIDHNDKTAKQFDEKETSGKWFGVDLGSVKDINTLEILLGANETDTNVASTYRVQVSNDSQTWRDIETQKSQNVVTNIQKENARFIRYYVEEGCQKVSQVREFYVNRIDRTLISNLEHTDDVNISSTNNDLVVETSKELVLSTQDYIGIQFEKAKKIPSMEGATNLTIEYSIDNIHWYPYEHKETIANYVRVINHSDQDITLSDTLLTIHLSNAIIPQQMNVTSTGLVTWSGNERDLVDGNRSSYHWTRSQSIGNGYTIDLHESIPLNDITVVMGDGDYMVEGVIEISNDLTSWTPIGTIKNQKVTTVYGENEEARYLRIRMTKNSDNWLKLAEVEVNKLASSTDAPLLDDELAHAVIDQDLTSGYQVSQDAGSLTYHRYRQFDADTLYVLKNKEAVMRAEVLVDNEWNVMEGTGDTLVSYDLSSYQNASDVRISWESNSGLVISELMFKKVGDVSIDVTLLEEQIERCYDLIESAYTMDSWTALQTALKQAEELLINENATQKMIDEMTSTLTNRQSELLKRASTPSIQTLRSACAELEAMRKEYSEIEFTEASKAIEQATLVLAKDEKNIGVKEVQESMMLLATAKGNLQHNVMLDALRVVCEQADQILASDELDNVRPGQIEVLRQAREAAQELIDTNCSDQVTIQQAEKTLLKAMQELYKIVDKENVKSLVEDTKTLQKDRYTEDSWTALMKALEEAERIINNDDATTDEVQGVYDALLVAIQQLEIRVDKEALKQQLDIANMMIAQKDQYIVSTIKGLQQVVKEAEALYQNEEASQAEVSAMTEKLIQEMSKARLKADKKVLEEALRYAKGINFNNYTTTQVAGVKETIAKAQAIFENEEATQEEVNAIADQLQKEITALVEQKETVVKEVEKEVAKNVPTGDQSNTAGMVGLIMLSGIVVVCIRKRRK